MLYLTRSQIKTIVKNELDLNDEKFITDTELNDYLIKSVDRAEQIILGIKEDYFLTSASLALVTDTSDYSLPSDIYAQKIRGIMYRNGNVIYPITKLKTWHKFEKKAIMDQFNTSAELYTYQYLIRNDNSDPTSISYKLVLVPAAKETSSTNVTIWYNRNANRPTADTHVVDIPEATNFIITHMKAQCLAKENGGIIPPESKNEIDREEALLTSALTEAQEDNDNEVEADFSHYNDHM